MSVAPVVPVIQQRALQRRDAHHLSFHKNKSYAENSRILALLLGSAREIPMTRYPTRITPFSPSLSQTGGSGSLCRRDTNKCVFRYSLPSPLSIHILPCPTEPSRMSFPSSPTQLVIQTRTFPLPAAMIPQTRLEQYLAAQPGAMRGPYCAEHIRRRRRWWTGLRCIQPKHLLDCSGCTGSGQLHVADKDRFLGGTVRGLNAVPSKSSSRNGNGRRGNGTMDAKEGNVHTAACNVILVGFGARF